MKQLFRLTFSLISLALAARLSAGQKVTSPQHWVGTWAASPQMPPEDSAGTNSADSGFNNQTVRMIVRVCIGGKELRVRFSNAFGKSALTIGDAHVALAGKGSVTLPGSDRTLTFSGCSSFIVPPGAELLSDPVRLDVPALSSLAITVFLPVATGSATWHALGNQTAYISGPGDFTSTADMPVAKKTQSWFWLSGVEVLASDSVAAIVTLGDSITDGFNSTLDANHRWPDILANEIAIHSGAPLAVLNEGISGNRLLHEQAGPNALARFDRDVLSQDGVRYLIVLEGINDIGVPHIRGGNYAAEAVSTEDIIAALGQIAGRAHAHGILVYAGTLTPFGGAFYETPDGEAERQAVNDWIRTGGAFDGVIDFDKLTRDPAHPEQFSPKYDSGDHLHPGDAGYAAMGQLVAKFFSFLETSHLPR